MIGSDGEEVCVGGVDGRVDGRESPQSLLPMSPAE